MDSDEANVDQGSTKFSLLELIKKIITLYLSILSAVYNKFKDILERIYAFIHDTFDKYAPSPIKSLQTTIDSQSHEALNKTKSLLGGVPILGNVMGGLQQTVSNTADAAHDIIDRTTSLVTDNPIAQAVNSAADKMMQEAASAGKKAALKSVYTSLTLLGVPLIAEVWYKLNTNELFSKLANLILPLIEKLCNGYNKLLDTMEEKGYSFFEYLPSVPIVQMEAAYALVKTTNDGLTAVGEGIENVEEFVGDIPGVGQVADAAHNLVDGVATLVTENPLSQALGSAADQIIDGTEEFATKAALKSVYASLTLLICPAIAGVCVKLREYALIKALGKMIVPIIEEVCEWYNAKLKELDDNGYEFFGYLPTMPIAEMKAAYKLAKVANAGLEAVGDGISAVGDAVGLNNDDD